ncbi:dihydrolipoamide dehydrogenase [Amphibacillus marinus]|uniref:Dihydrolipoyl dehydrogenase n=1 Tax=Amphibacillus marinus TaxID=872970 RepID=A0A1H8NK05_9BACI|nr:dihydrolipoyl dehydrogenase [Amphibacillus marinus]SEO29944.1 dihydrolipoamide dehydrogenase [Amphibacillus marinus]
MAKNYDLVILGGGMGGYVAAIRAKQLGLSVALVEEQLIGGTCLHRGCIPTKALLKSASLFHSIKHSKEYGVEVDEPTLNINIVQSRKDQIVEQLYRGLQQLMKKNKIDIFNGYGRMLGPSIFSPLPGTISVQFKDDKENEMLIGKNILLATGSKPRNLEQLPFNQDSILSSDDALKLNPLPKSIIIVGGGVIGVEWASMLIDFGVEVTVVEAANQLLPQLDRDLAKVVERELSKRGVTIIKNSKVIASEHVGEQVELIVEQKQDQQKLLAEKVLVSVGREPNSSNIGLENTSILRDDHGFIKVNSHYQTQEAHIYAVGDVIGGFQLAHVAAAEGKAAVEHIAGIRSFANPHQPISCVYSHPEVASVGLSEREAKESGQAIIVKKVPFSAIGKALINGNATGFIKIISNQDSEDLVGVHMVGEHVTELISEAGLALVLDATAAEIGHTVHPHPSLSEAFQETALAINDLQIHG